MNIIVRERLIALCEVRLRQLEAMLGLRWVNEAERGLYEQEMDFLLRHAIPELKKAGR